jgi:hypothetical protein
LWGELGPIAFAGISAFLFCIFEGQFVGILHCFGHWNNANINTTGAAIPVRGWVVHQWQGRGMLLPGNGQAFISFSLPPFLYLLPFFFCRSFMPGLGCFDWWPLAPD